MDPHHPPLDHGDLALSHLRHLPRRALGLLGAWLGWILGMGSGRERLADAMAHRYRLPALSDDAGEARHDEELECVADLLHLHALDSRYAAHALRTGTVRARLRAVL